MPDDPEISRATQEMGEAAGRAYQEIRSRILSGVLMPGDSLRERELCISVGVSRTPVREALRRLNAEGLVTLNANRTASVTQLDAAEINDIFSIGALLGAYAGRLAADRASDEQVAALGRLVDSLERALDGDDAEIRQAFATVGREFDLVLRAATGSPRLQKLIVQTLSAPVLPFIVARLRRSHFAAAVRLRRRIYDAVAARDGDAAAAAMTEYAETARASALAALDEITSGRASAG